jgi:hypothetical protein
LVFKHACAAALSVRALLKVAPAAAPVGVRISLVAKAPTATESGAALNLFASMGRRRLQPAPQACPAIEAEREARVAAERALEAQALRLAELERRIAELDAWAEA